MTLEQTVPRESSSGEFERSIRELQCQRMEAIGRLAGRLCDRLRRCPLCGWLPRQGGATRGLGGRGFR